MNRNRGIPIPVFLAFVVFAMIGIWQTYNEGYDKGYSDALAIQQHEEETGINE